MGKSESRESEFPPTEQAIGRSDLRIATYIFSLDYLLGELMAAAAAQTYLTPEEYITLERKAIPDAETVRSEYAKGKIIAMSGASRAHNLITVQDLRIPFACWGIKGGKSLKMTKNRG